jgi:hypothetical protein
MGGTGMKPFDDNDVRDRAFYLWERAGRPDRSMDDFWYEAERQLREEQAQTEEKAPKQFS